MKREVQYATYIRGRTSQPDVSVEAWGKIMGPELVVAMEARFQRGDLPELQKAEELQKKAIQKFWGN